jgi:tRNA A37 methylthiotransferase MiaB
VPHAEKLRRLNDLLGLQRQIAARKTTAWLGRPVEVLVEGQDELGRSYGRSRQGKRVVVKGARVEPGRLVKVRVDAAGAGQLSGPLAA